MDVFLNLEDTSVAFHLNAKADVEVLVFLRCSLVVTAVHGIFGVVGILYPLACVDAVFVGVDGFFHKCFVQIFHQPVFAGEVHHRARLAVLGQHIQCRHSGSIGYAFVVGTKGGGDMYDARTVLRSDVVSRNNAESVCFAVDDLAVLQVNRVHPREELLVVQANQVGALVVGQDLGLFA